MVVVGKGNTAMKGGPTVTPMPDSVVIDEDFNLVEPGSGVVGKVARHGNIPLGYYKDEVKTAETFVTGPDGTRYAVPGDFATVEADGSITLLGRGSVSINSGRREDLPRGGRGRGQGASAVYDAIGHRRAGRALGPAGRRRRPAAGRRRAAVAQGPPGALPHGDRRLQGPPPAPLRRRRRLRSPSGKPDYRWAARPRPATPT